MGTDEKCNTSKQKVMHIWINGYKMGTHNLQMVEKGKNLSIST